METFKGILSRVSEPQLSALESQSNSLLTLSLAFLAIGATTLYAEKKLGFTHEDNLPEKGLLRITARLVSTLSQGAGGIELGLGILAAAKGVYELALIESARYRRMINVD